MLVYRSVESVDDARRLLESVEDTIAAAAARDSSHDAFVDTLLAAAELETAVLDARFGAADGIDSVERALRRATESAAAALVASWRGDRARLRACANELDRPGAALTRLVTAGAVHCRIPEGFAYYSVFPESYVDAASRFACQRQPESVTVVGIRTIGAALAAAVVASLRASGIGAESCTVRPRGHPFDRHVAMTARLRSWLRERERGWFAIVDEGPGISGSSFASVSRALAELGVPDDRIVLFPSWLPSGDSLCNEDARRRWRAHEKFAETFEQAFVASDRLARTWDAAIESDWSGGRWRAALCQRDESPASQPQHEQRKYVCRAPDASRFLLKFVGLGRYGRRRYEIAQRLSGAGLGPRVYGLRHGFAAMEIVGGLPAVRSASRDDIAAIASYVARRSGCMRATNRPVKPGDLITAVRVNVGESLGAALAERACEVVRQLEVAPFPCLVDARMQPHEWIRAGGSLFKTDGVAHHDDHFLEPPGDPTWDLAGASVEWRLDAAQEECLIREYSSASGDTTAAGRLAPYRVAYLSYRIGYASLSADTLGDSADGRGMRALAERYAARLRAALEVQ